MNPNTRTIPEIIELASAYYGSAVLFAALEVDAFTAIRNAGGSATSETLAQQAGADPRGMRLLLDACAALGLLAKTADGVYANTQASVLTLVTGAPNDLTRAIRYNRDVYPAWGRTAELVRTGRPVEAPEIHLGEDPERTRAFVMSMHGRALGIGRAVVPLLDLTGCRTLLDLAGGPGTYAVLLAQANPGLSCVTTDLPAVAAVAAQLVAATDVAGRVTCRAGDYHTDAYEPETYDAVTIFGALHQESQTQIVSILKRAHVALRPGGKIFILDMMTDATHTQPAFSALFAVNMALTTANGWVFSDEELKGWLAEAGFANARTQPVPPPMPHWLVSAEKIANLE
ncbi:MAG: acetylserotonin O-methyltransferase [Kiritimatiellaeota bacterium]|nr:acetylserotonin O-methyltransferase [Kiritimatiellota bacterium]